MGEIESAVQCVHNLDVTKTLWLSFALKCEHTLSLSHIHTYRHAHSCTHTRPNADTETHKQTLTQMHPLTLKKLFTYTHTLINVHPPTRMHAPTHTHTHTPTHPHACTHSQQIYLTHLFLEKLATQNRRAKKTLDEKFSQSFILMLSWNSIWNESWKMQTRQIKKNLAGS